MTDLLAVAFNDVGGADAVLHKLRRLRQDDLVEVEDACSAERDRNGELHLKQASGSRSHCTRPSGAALGPQPPRISSAVELLHLARQEKEEEKDKSVRAREAAEAERKRRLDRLRTEPLRPGDIAALVEHVMDAAHRGETKVLRTASRAKSARTGAGPSTTNCRTGRTHWSGNCARSTRIGAAD